MTWDACAGTSAPGEALEAEYRSERIESDTSSLDRYEEVPNPLCQPDRTSAVRRHIRGFGNAFCLVRGLGESVTGEFV